MDDDDDFGAFEDGGETSDAQPADETAATIIPFVGSAAAAAQNPDDEGSDDDGFGDFDAAPAQTAAAAPVPEPPSVDEAPSILELQGDEFVETVRRNWAVLGAQDPAITAPVEEQELEQLRHAMRQLPEGAAENSLLYNNGVPLSAFTQSAGPGGSDAIEPMIKCDKALVWKGTDSEARLLASLGLTEIAAQAKEVEAAEEEAARQRRTSRMHATQSNVSLGSLSHIPSTSSSALADMPSMHGRHQSSTDASNDLDLGRSGSQQNGTQRPEAPAFVPWSPDADVVSPPAATPQAGRSQTKAGPGPMCEGTEDGGAYESLISASRVASAGLAKAPTLMNWLALAREQSNCVASALDSTRENSKQDSPDNAEQPATAVFAGAMPAQGPAGGLNQAPVQEAVKVLSSLGARRTFLNWRDELRQWEQQHGEVVVPVAEGSAGSGAQGTLLHRVFVPPDPSGPLLDSTQPVQEAEDTSEWLLGDEVPAVPALANQAMPGASASGSPGGASDSASPRVVSPGSSSGTSGGTLGRTLRAAVAAVDEVTATAAAFVSAIAVVDELSASTRAVLTAANGLTETPRAGPPATSSAFATPVRAIRVPTASRSPTHPFISLTLFVMDPEPSTLQLPAPTAGSEVAVAVVVQESDEAHPVRVTVTPTQPAEPSSDAPSGGWVQVQLDVLHPSSSASSLEALQQYEPQLLSPLPPQPAVVDDVFGALFETPAGKEVPEEDPASVLESAFGARLMAALRTMSQGLGAGRGSRPPPQLYSAAPDAPRQPGWRTPDQEADPLDALDYEQAAAVAQRALNVTEREGRELSEEDARAAQALLAALQQGCFHELVVDMTDGQVEAVKWPPSKQKPMGMVEAHELDVLRRHYEWVAQLELQAAQAADARDAAARARAEAEEAVVRERAVRQLVSAALARAVDEARAQAEAEAAAAASAAYAAAHIQAVSKGGGGGLWSGKEAGAGLDGAGEGCDSSAGAGSTAEWQPVWVHADASSRVYEDAVALAPPGAASSSSASSSGGSRLGAADAGATAALPTDSVVTATGAQFEPAAWPQPELRAQPDIPPSQPTPVEPSTPMPELEEESSIEALEAFVSSSTPEKATTARAAAASTSSHAPWQLDHELASSSSPTVQSSPAASGLAGLRDIAHDEAMLRRAASTATAAARTAGALPWSPVTRGAGSGAAVLRPEGDAWPGSSAALSPESGARHGSQACTAQQGSGAAAATGAVAVVAEGSLLGASAVMVSPAPTSSSTGTGLRGEVSWEELLGPSAEPLSPHSLGLSPPVHGSSRESGEWGPLQGPSGSVYGSPGREAVLFSRGCVGEEGLSDDGEEEEEEEEEEDAGSVGVDDSLDEERILQDAVTAAASAASAVQEEEVVAALSRLLAAGVVSPVSVSVPASVVREAKARAARVLRLDSPGPSPLQAAHTALAAAMASPTISISTTTTTAAAAPYATYSSHRGSDQLTYAAIAAGTAGAQPDFPVANYPQGYSGAADFALVQAALSPRGPAASPPPTQLQQVLADSPHRYAFAELVGDALAPDRRRGQGQSLAEAKAVHLASASASASASAAASPGVSEAGAAPTPGPTQLLGPDVTPSSSSRAWLAQPPPPLSDLEPSQPYVPQPEQLDEDPFDELVPELLAGPDVARAALQQQPQRKAAKAAQPEPSRAAAAATAPGLGPFTAPPPQDWLQAFKSAVTPSRGTLPDARTPPPTPFWAALAMPGGLHQARGTAAISSPASLQGIDPLYAPSAGGASHKLPASVWPEEDLPPPPPPPSQPHPSDATSSSSSKKGRKQSKQAASSSSSSSPGFSSKPLSTTSHAPHAHLPPGTHMPYPYPVYILAPPGMYPAAAGGVQLPPMPLHLLQAGSPAAGAASPQFYSVASAWPGSYQAGSGAHAHGLAPASIQSTARAPYLPLPPGVLSPGVAGTAWTPASSFHSVPASVYGSAVSMAMPPSVRHAAQGGPLTDGAGADPVRRLF